MSADLHDLLDRGISPRPTDVDGDALVARGVKRRQTKRAAASVLSIAVLLGGGAALATLVTGPEAPIVTELPGAAPVEWSKTSDAPITPRITPDMAVDGDRVLVWAGVSSEPYVSPAELNGVSFGEIHLLDGGVYDAATDRWTPVPAPPIAARHAAALRLTGDTALVWGGRTLTAVGDGAVAAFDGSDQGLVADGAVWSFVDETWTIVPPGPLDARRPAAVDWDGETLLVWGGSDDSPHPLADGATWTAADGWQPMAAFPLEARDGSAVAWDDDRLIVWGGGTNLDPEPGTEKLLNDGAVYDRATDRWDVLPASDLPAGWFDYGDAEPSARLDGDRFWVLGGAQTTPLRYELGGARLDLSTGVWEPTATAPDAARYIKPSAHGAVAERDEGASSSSWRYDVEDDRWVDLPPPQGSSLHGPGLRATNRTVIGSLMGDDTWRPVTLVRRDGDAVRPGLAERGGDMRQFYTTATLDSGVLLFGGHLVSLDRDGVSSTSDGTMRNFGWFLPFG